MNLKLVSRLGLSALNLVVIGGSLISGQAQAAPSNEAKMDVLNAASLTAIEGSWLRVPIICKARGFNADPVGPQVTALRPQVQDIYSRFEA